MKREANLVQSGLEALCTRTHETIALVHHFSLPRK